MFAILGAAGKIGFATCTALRDAGMPVRAIVRSESKAAKLRDIGCEVNIADLQDTAALTAAFTGAKIVQVIVPLSPQVPDPVQDMRSAIESITLALEKAKPSLILAISDYGAHVTHDIGMPSIFHTLEKKFSQLQGHKIFLRSAEHMQNWGRSIPAAIETGVLPSFSSPAASLQPTISASDVGLIAANLLLGRSESTEDSVEIVHAEASQRYRDSDVALALSQLADREISVGTVPRAEWESIFGKTMKETLAKLLIRTNDTKNEGGMIDVDRESGTVVYGTTSLIDALRPLVPTKSKGMRG